MPKMLDFRAFCRFIGHAVFASLLCIFSAFADTETTLTYVCGPGSHSIMTPNTELVNIGGSYTIDATLGSNHCAPDNNEWSIFLIRCKQGNGVLCSGGMGSGCYINYMPAEGATCTIYFKDKNDEVEVIEITDPCDDGEILATYYSVNGVNYSNYDSNGPSGQITEGTSLGGYPDNSCFIGFSYEQCFNDVSTSCNTGTFALSHAVANSYGEWLPGNGYGNGPDDHGTNPLYSVNLNSGHALRLSSVTADPVSHGTEFVWYCSAQDVGDLSQQYTYSCNGGQQCTSGCYGQQVGLYPITRNLSCCTIGTYVNSNNNHHLGYQVDFSHPLTINNNSNNNIEIPTRSGYVFLGYYNTPDGYDGIQYVDENGVLTAAGLSAAASQINSTPAGICAQWYAHWCQADPVTGMCSDCPQGTSSQDMTYIFEQPEEYDEGVRASYGKDIDVSGGFFESGDDPNKETLKAMFEHNSYGAGNFGVMLSPSEKSIFGSSMCVKQEGIPEYIGNSGEIEKWLQSYSSMDTTPGEYCWCNINGFSVDGANIVNVALGDWFIAYGYSDNSECEKYCTRACAGLFAEHPENIATLLKSETGCLPDPQHVTYWCSDSAYQEQNTDKIGVVDTSFYGQTYSTGGRDADVLNNCGYNSAGYSIAGYKCFTSPYPGTEVFSPWTVNGDVDCFPELEPNVFTITLNKNGGTSGSGAVYSRFNDGVYLNNNNGNLSNQMLTNNNNVITVPTRTDYTFKGYYSSVNSNVQYIDANGKITQTGINTGKGYTNNATWYAQWEENVSTTYSVTYDCNNNNSGGTAPAVVSGLESGQSTNAPSGSSCTAPTGQHFFGWSCSNGTTFTTYLVGNSITVGESDIDCDGIWIADAPCANPDTFVLGSPLNQSPVGNNWNENVNDPTQIEYTADFYDDFSYGRVYVRGMCSSQSGIQGVPIDGTPSVSGSPLNQCWCRVFAYDNDVTDSVPAISLSYTPWVYLRDSSMGECNDGACGEYCAHDMNLVMRQSLYTYYRCSYTVSFAGGYSNNDGTGTAATGEMSAQTGVHYADTITLPDNGNNPPTNGFSLDGYTFSGWKCGSSVNNNATLAANDTFTMPAANVICTAQWEAVPTTTVNYVCSTGGTQIAGVINPVTVNVGSSYNVVPNSFCQPDMSGWVVEYSCGVCSSYNNCTVISSVPAGGVTCYVYYHPEGVNIYDLNPCDEFGYYYDNIPTPYYYSSNNIPYLNYINGSLANEIIALPNSQNPVNVPNNACFIGYSAEGNACNAGATYLYMPLFNSYGEWTGQYLGHGDAWYLDSDHALKLNSSDADVGGHGTEFLWYCASSDSCYGHSSGLYQISNNIGSNSFDIDWVLLDSNNAITVPTRTGYVFNGYYNTPDGTSGAQYVDENGYVTSTGLTAVSNAVGGNDCAQWYAHWTAVATTTYSVTYDCNNGNSGGTAPTAVSGLSSGQSTSAPSGSSCTAPTGQHFLGWSCSNGNTYLLGENITVSNSDIECYVVWGPVASCNGGVSAVKYILNLQATNASSIDFTENPVNGTENDPVGSFSLSFNDYGTVSGIGMCSSQSGTFGVPISGTPETSTNNTHCWCKVNNYNDLNSVSASLEHTMWVYNYDTHISSSLSACLAPCTERCRYAAQNSSLMRRSLYTYYRCPYNITYYPGTPAAGVTVAGSTTNQTGIYWDEDMTMSVNGYSATGYSFNNWSCCSGANVCRDTDSYYQTFNDGQAIAAVINAGTYDNNLYCTAQWNPNTIYLAWLLNGGTITGTNAPMCTYGTSAGQNGSITPIHDPTRNGYRFTGWTVNAGLPTGYTRLSYLQSDGNQYIDTGIGYSADTNIVVKLKAQSDYTSGNISSNNIALGFGNGSGQWFGVSPAGKWNIGPAPDYSSDISASNVTDGLEITWSGGAESLKINNVSVANNRDVTTPSSNLQLFGRGSEGRFQGKIYYVRVFQGGALQRNFIPVQYGNDLGLFDTVTGEFFVNQGSGSFTGQ